MAATDLYILPENVSLIPIADIAEQTRNKFEYEANDFILTYLNGRQTSKVIDAASASLLKTFKTPSSIVEGIFKYSVLHNLNPQDTAEQAFAVLSKFRTEGFLVLLDKKATDTQKNILNPGEAFHGYTVTEKIQGIEDTQVYKVKKGDINYILKILQINGKGPEAIVQQFENEVSIMKQLDNTVNPSIIESGVSENTRYLVMQCFEGKPCDIFAGQFRNTANLNNLQQLLRLSLNILTAYTQLHNQGVAHGDIHPKNILVSENNTVCIIDFGLSAVAQKKQALHRGGVSFFFEPEYAVNITQHKHPPAASFKGEQYALAALLYYLLTGKYYINFSYEKDNQLQQIINEQPVPFSKLDIEIAPAIEQVLIKALSKSSEDRFSSTIEFKNAFADAIENSIKKIYIESERLNSASAFCDTIKSKFGLEGSFIDKGLQAPPFASVNYGAAGIAYMFYRMALIESDPELLAVADIWINRAMRFLQDETSAFYSKEMDITKEIAGEISIYHTESGVHLVQALITKTIGHKARFDAAVSNFIMAASKKCENPDVTLGKSGILIGSAILLEQMNDNTYGSKEELLLTGNNTLNAIWNELDIHGDINSNKKIDYRGVAHGWAGILYATIYWCKQSNTRLPTNFYSRIEELAGLGIEEKNYIRWAVTNDNPASWTGWCHGSAGYTLLWSMLYQYTNDEKYIELAKKTANHFLDTSVSLNVSLCCGLSGECYALLRLFNITGDDFYLQQAKLKIKKILPNTYSHEARNHSLYKGDIGAAVLLTEMANPAYARMPLFE